MIVCEVKFDDNQVNYAGNHARSSIINSELSEADKNVLLNYPVVYIHTWLINEKRYFYVGETIDLVSRTNQHRETANDEKNRIAWQKSWVEGADRISFYFGHEEMNKSLSLDLEDSMIKLLGANIDSRFVKNGRENEQGLYSNCNRRTELLREMYSFMHGRFSELIPEYSDALSKVSLSEYCHDMSDDEYWYSKPFVGYKDFCKNTNEIDLLKKYPTVYIHVWLDNNKLNTYVGETNNLISRTKQHYENENIDVFLERKYLFDNDTHWRGEWQKAVANGRAWMFAYTNSKVMNKSITLDLENLLIDYSYCIETSNNGRTNEQRCYGNRNQLLGEFNKIVSNLVEDEGFSNWIKAKDKDANKTIGFKSLENVRKDSIFMASTITVLSETQLKAKNDLCAQIVDILQRGGDKSKNDLFIIEGGAGTGKTVIASSLYYDLLDADINARFIVNHHELFSSYNVQNLARKIGTDKNIQVLEPAEFINSIKRQYISSALNYICDEEKQKLLKKFSNNYDKAVFYNVLCEFMGTVSKGNFGSNKLDDKLIKEIMGKKYTARQVEDICNIVFENNNVEPSIEIPDVVIIDEGHLLSVNGLGGTSPESQLAYIVSKVKVTVVVFDLKQFVKKNAYISCETNNTKEVLTSFLSQRGITNLDIFASNILQEQFRMQCSDNTIEWIKNLVKDNSKIENIRSSSNSDYIIKDNTIIEKNDAGEEIYQIKICESIDDLLTKMEGVDHSKILATYNWPYKKDEKRNIFEIGGHKFVWHATKKSKDIWVKSSEIKDSEIKYAYEVGSYHDIQGFDLDFAGVIIGESYYLENGRVRINANARADETKKNPDNYSKELIENELAVLLTRGVKGICIYATNKDLRDELLRLVKSDQS